MNLTSRFIFVILSSLALCTASLHAQSRGAAEAFNEATLLFSAGKFQEAAEGYAALLTNYPTDGVVPNALIQLAYSYLYLGKYDEGLETLEKAFNDPAINPDLKRRARSVQAQILSQQAGTFAMDDPKREETYKKAIEAITEYIKEFPQADDIETLVYIRAINHLQIGNFKEAAADCELNIQRFPNTPMTPSVRNLLALVYATEGSQLLVEGKDKARGFELYGKAVEILTKIIDERADIALLNDALFQRGEIYFNWANFTEGAEREKLFDRAFDTYNSIIPLSEIIENQQAIIDSFPDRMRDLVLQRLDAQSLARARAQLERDNRRQLNILTALKSKPDPLPRAMLKIAEIYVQRQQYNEARTLLNHVADHLITDDERKSQLYFLTLTYAHQNQVQEAVSNYERFQSQFKGDPIAQSLSLTMGNMFLSLEQPDPEAAIPYFEAAIADYGDNPQIVALASVGKANALLALGQQEASVETFRTLLDSNPTPEVAAGALSGLANAYRMTQQLEEALKTYQEIIEKFPNSPQATEAAAWLAIIAQQKGENAQAIERIDAFLKDHPDHPLAPLALYTKGAAQLALNKTAEALATMQQVGEKFPDTPVAPFSYFIRAQTRMQEGNYEEVIAILEQFVEKYPDHDEKDPEQALVFNAFNLIAQNQINAGKSADAIATYKKFADRYPENPRGALLLYQAADFLRKAALSRGRYTALSDEPLSEDNPMTEKELWMSEMNDSIAISERVLNQFPESEHIPLVLANLLDIKRTFVAAGIQQPEEAEKYFQDLADAAPSPEQKSQILFTLSDFVSTSDKERAAKIMTEAYDPAITYSPSDLDRLATILIANGQLDEAAKIAEKLLADYPMPEDPATATLPTLQAQAYALFIKATLLEKKGETQAAGELFDELTQKYPWSPKVLEAQFGKAQGLKAAGNDTEALQILTGIIRSNIASAELRANAMFLFAQIYDDQAARETDPVKKDQALNNAIDNYIKISQFYAGVPLVAAEGLWKGSQLLELQAELAAAAAAAVPNNKNAREEKARLEKLREAKLNRARMFYNDLVKNFPTTSFAEKGKERLEALGPATPARR